MRRTQRQTLIYRAGTGAASDRVEVGAMARCRKQNGHGRTFSGPIVARLKRPSVFLLGMARAFVIAKPPRWRSVALLRKCSRDFGEQVERFDTERARDHQQLDDINAALTTLVF